MRNAYRRLFAPLSGAFLIVACSSPKPAAPAKPESPALWGDMKPVVSVKELMRYTIDPASDYIFDAVSTTVERGGVKERLPKTDEDWDKIRSGAVMLAETSDLLKVPRPFAPEGDQNNSVGADATELAPAEILAKVTRDPVEWNARIQALRNVALETLEIVKKKNASEMWDAAENLDNACEQCHVSYWYPKEDAAFYQKIDRTLRDFSARSPQRGTGAAPSAR
jgi:hypothetical protein